MTFWIIVSAYFALGIAFSFAVPRWHRRGDNVLPSTRVLAGLIWPVLAVIWLVTVRR